MTDHDLNDRRVLVTGGSGFIGRHVVAELVRVGARVRIIDLLPHPDAEIEIVIGDIADPAAVAAALDGGMDSIVHLAAVTSVLKSVQEPEGTSRTNVGGTTPFWGAARAAGVSSLALPRPTRSPGR